jgi:hypothetical protein
MVRCISLLFLYSSSILARLVLLFWLELFAPSPARFGRFSRAQALVRRPCLAQYSSALVAGL